MVRCKLCKKEAETVEEYCKYVIRFIKRGPGRVAGTVSEDIIHFLLCGDCIRKLTSIMQDPGLIKFLGN